jgi:hypothetical protein
MNPTILRTGLLMLIAAGGYSEASARSPQQPAPPPSTTQPSPNRPEVIAWLDCVECRAELKELTLRGDQVVPELRAVLLNGPSKERLDRQQRHLEKTYSALKEYERQHPSQKVPLSQSDYVRLYQQKYVLLNRGRAARALGAIATPQAKAALTEALNLKADLPTELLRDVELALSGKLVQ